MARIRTLAPLVPKSDGRTVKTEPKQADPFYQDPRHKQFRAVVLARSGYRCEALDERGARCTKSAPAHMLFADHIEERNDGGDLYDPANGQCLCGSHHTSKTMRERARRHGLSEGVGG
jgi:5-methylcytosine-specific restriction enzyme A